MNKKKRLRPHASHHQAVYPSKMDREDSEDDPIVVNGEGLPNSRADIESLPSAPPNSPTSIVENGLGSPESMPSIPNINIL